MEIVTKFLSWVLSVLPTSPFTLFINKMADIPFLSTLNYFIPVGSMIAIGQAWLLSVGLFYLYSIILRWIRAIE